MAGTKGDLWVELGHEAKKRGGAQAVRNLVSSVHKFGFLFIAVGASRGPEIRGLTN